MRWSACLPGAVVVALDPEIDPADVAVSLKPGWNAAAIPLDRYDAAFDGDDQRLVFFRIADGLAQSLAEARVITKLPGTTHRSDPFRFGEGRFAIVIEGVVDYRLVGWAAPLFEVEHFEIDLLVDGELAERAAPRLLRRDLMSASREGGWNGFGIALPPGALDGRPHRLALRSGATLAEFGSWSAAPKYHIDHVEPRRLTGWFFDAGLLDVPATVSLRAGGRDVARQTTHPRSDLKELFQRSSGAFAFTDIPIEPGMEVRIGPGSGGVVLGHVAGTTRTDRIRRLQAEARSTLLASDAASASFAARRAIREGPIAQARSDPDTQLHWQSGSRDGAAQGRGAPAGGRHGTAATSSKASPKACAIVPVYRGIAELKACIASLIPQIEPGRFRLVVIDDASPEPEVADWLSSGELRRVGVTIVTNERNRGFIGTVNRGFAELEPGEDAIIVNSDTVLPPGAISRLAGHCHSRPGIASVTPMSNNATILSFPSTRLRNGPLLGLPVDALDREFATAGGGLVELPTAIGFCMYVNRDALDEVGPFSPEWGRGYCEEVDWSLMARDLGWIHLAATDIFVEHEGSVSFGSAERARILADNHARLEAKYPEYLGEVMEIVAADPFEGVRRRVLATCMARDVDHLTLHVMHGLGGGTKRYVDDLAALPRDTRHEIGVATLFTDESGTPRLRLSFDAAAAVLEIAPDSLQTMLDELERAGIGIRIHVNSRLNYGSAFLDAIALGPRPYTVTLHDYQWYCPKVHLIDERVFYCGEPPPEVCQICVRHRQTHDFGDHNATIQSNIEDWLDFNRRFLRGAELVIAPSQDTAERYRDRIGLTNVLVRPHPEPLAETDQAVLRPRPKRGRLAGLRIAIVGALGDHKGFDLVVRMTELAERRRLPLFVEVIGYTPDGTRLTRLSNAAVSGAYEPDEITGRLRRSDPDFVFLPSVWPETYSYVLSEAWAAGYPVVAFDFGAQAERIRAHGGGVLIPPTRDASELLDALFAARSRLPERVAAAPPNAVASLEDYYAPAPLPGEPHGPGDDPAAP